jgi:gamma-butyrobetaine dioxygenase
VTGQADGAAEHPECSGGPARLPVDAHGGVLGLPAIWLRDNCGCAECRDPASGKRLASIAEFPAEVFVVQARQAGRRVEVEFGPEPHRSVYDAGWLEQFRSAAAGLAAGPAGGQAHPHQGPVPRASLPVPDDGRNEDAKQLWDTAQITRAFPQGSWPLYLDSAAHQEACLRAVLGQGFVLITGVPREPDAVLSVAQSIGLVRETERGRIVDVRVGAAAPSVVAATRPLAPSTSLPFRDPLMTVMLVHCLEDAAHGGEPMLVDGFCAAARLRHEHPAAFAALATTPVTFARADARAELRATRPVISVDPRGRIREIHFASSYLAPLSGPASEIAAFYAAYRLFALLVRHPELVVTFRMRPGDCLILDNTRVLHGRAAFTDPGQRHLQACWTDLDGLASRLAVLGRRRHNGRSRH